MNRSGLHAQSGLSRPGWIRRHAKHLFLVLSFLVVASVFWYLKRPHGLMAGNGGVADLLAGHAGGLITDLHVTQFDQQKTRWTLDAPSAQRGEEKQVIIHHPRLELTLAGQEPVVITAEGGVVDASTGRMEFTGRVEAGDPATGRLMTEQLRFDPEKRILYTEQAFRLERENMRLEGHGLTLEQETRKLKVDRHVKMIFPEAILTTEQP
ncbi:MAG: LPS export ABC transporter periplasmic protein LptC [Magnetococcales bacterium]|nr:LPS export ABC transporter periplasmic protein LptC [Magnetococcales bacterium]NGZ05402.1 LPS export ABC transporter periplasmic protein LptC [Magnetococcales bacterium]